MERKIEVDLVLLQFEYALDSSIEALAMKQGEIVDYGSIPYVFSHYKGRSLFHGQGNALHFFDLKEFSLIPLPNAVIEIGCNQPFGLLIKAEKTGHDLSHVIAYWRKGLLEHEDSSLLDEHWDDH